MTVQLQSLAAYYAALMGADFDFENSDDPGFYRHEKAKIDGLREQADASEQHRALFEAFRLRNGRDLPLPERPVEEAAE